LLPQLQLRCAATQCRTRAIVRRLIKRHGGHIRAESVPGEQTTFALTLGLANS
jgi:signal transduction histidine kinase